MSFASLQMSPEFLQSILLALFLGSLVGIERQWHRRLVDLKTNALVAMGACLFLLLSRTPQGFVDPIRMAAQIVVGVGFIGGGILFRDGGQTKGLNTAATLWCSAAVGALCGMDRWVDASVAAITIVLANTLLRRVAQFLNLQMGINDQLTDSLQFQWSCRPRDAVAVHSNGCCGKSARKAGVRIKLSCASRFSWSTANTTRRRSWFSKPWTACRCSIFRGRNSETDLRLRQPVIPSPALRAGRPTR
jgi:uncharacterized membrane protein YhiD involved in acid resistance